MTENKHDIFFSRKCPQGGEKYNRILSEGSVEMTWFLPTGKENKNEINNDATRILNLRGDAVEFEEEFDCLAHVSNKIVLLIDPGKVVKAGETNSIVEKIKFERELPLCEEKSDPPHMIWKFLMVLYPAHDLG